MNAGRTIFTVIGRSTVGANAHGEAETPLDFSA
jgi:hypothetical protein